MLVYGECDCFVMQMLYVCVLCASCDSSQCCVTDPPLVGCVVWSLLNSLAMFIPLIHLSEHTSTGKGSVQTSNVRFKRCQCSVNPFNCILFKGIQYFVRLCCYLM